MKFKLFAVSLLLTITLSSISSTGTIAAAATPHWYSPLLTLPHAWMPSVLCLMHVESRSTEDHPNLGDDNGAPDGQSGIFQMANYVGGVWDTYAMPRLHVVLWKASAYQQARGFVLVLRLDGGFHPWHGDGCVYPN